MASQIALLKTERYCANLANAKLELEAAQAFRARCFGLASAIDADPWDDAYDHLMIRTSESGRIVCCCRFKDLVGADISAGYTGQFYDLSVLETRTGPSLELGRFCIDPERRDPDILRLVWAILTGYVDRLGAGLLFGCSSFIGTDPARYAAAFGHLRQYAMLREGLSPARKADQICKLDAFSHHRSENRMALRQMPPLLRSYLGMGGGVSDHAVVDAAMNTLHVFTAVETASVPPARQKLLRSLPVAQP